MGCGASNQVIKTEYIRCDIPEIPEMPQYTPVIWNMRDGLYCLNRDNAINLLKNIELERAYCNDLMIIIKGVRDGQDNNSMSSRGKDGGDK